MFIECIHLLCKAYSCAGTQGWEKDTMDSSPFFIEYISNIFIFVRLPVTCVILCLISVSKLTIDFIDHEKVTPVIK